MPDLRSCSRCVVVVAALAAGAVAGCGSGDDQGPTVPARPYRLSDAAFGRIAERVVSPVAADQLQPTLRAMTGTRVGFGGCVLRRAPDEPPSGPIATLHVFCTAADGLDLSAQSYRSSVASVHVATPRREPRASVGCRTTNPGQRRCTTSYPVGTGSTILYFAAIARTDTVATALARTLRDRTLERLATGVRGA